MSPESNTLPTILAQRAQSHPNGTAFLRKEFGVWEKISWYSYLENSKNLSLGMIELGLKKDDKLAFISTNRPEWLYTEMGAMAAGAVPLGMYPESEEIEDFQKLIAWSDATFIVAEDQEQTDKIIKIRSRLPKLCRIIVIEFHEVRRYDDPMLIPFTEVLEMGKKVNQKKPDLFERNLATLKTEDVAILSTTSGTSALPKLVMLSHKNLISMARAINSRDPMTAKDKMLSLNPPAWIGERAFSLCWGPLTGFCMCFAENSETTFANFREIGPSAIFSGPRGWDDMISKILVRMEDAGFVKKMIYNIFMPIGTKVVELKLARKKVPVISQLLYGLGELVLFRYLRNLLGLSNMRNAYTGGGFLGIDQFIFFHAMGVNLRQIYGGTEASGVAVTQSADDISPNTVGTALPGMRAKVDETGEILLGGDNIMLGYYKNSKTTDETVIDGWLHTGDFGEIDQKTGNLVMLDRKKDIMILKSGTVFSPQAIETKLKFSPYIREAACFGDKRDSVTSLIQIDMDNVGKWAEQNQIPYTTFKDLSQRPEIYEMIRKEVEKAMHNIQDELKVVKFSLFEKELDPEDGEITHTRKLRRIVINEAYKPQIEALYSDQKTDFKVISLN